MKKEKKHKKKHKRKYNITTEESSKRGKSNSNKGKTFERLIANSLTDRLKELLREDEEFKRSPLSGGWSKRNKHTFGDLIVPERFRFCISCKNIRELELINLLLNKGNKKFLKYWEETKEMAKKSDKLPLLVINIQRRGIVAVVNDPGYNADNYYTLFNSYVVFRRRVLIYSWKKFLSHSDKYFFKED